MFILSLSLSISDSVHCLFLSSFARLLVVFRCFQTLGHPSGSVFPAAGSLLAAARHSGALTATSVSAREGASSFLCLAE